MIRMIRVMAILSIAVELSQRKNLTLLYDIYECNFRWGFVFFDRLENGTTLSSMKQDFARKENEEGIRSNPGSISRMIFNFHDPWKPMRTRDCLSEESFDQSTFICVLLLMRVYVCIMYMPV